MTQTLAELCYKRKQHFASTRIYPAFMPNLTPVREVLRQNLRTLMDRTPSLNTQAKVAKRAGIAQTSVSNLTRAPGPRTKAPRLDVVESVARAFGLSTWQILLDPKAVGEDLASLLLRPAASSVRVSRGVSGRIEEDWHGEERRGLK